MKNTGFKVTVLFLTIAVFIISGYIIYRKIKELESGFSQLNQLVQQKDVTIKTLTGQMQEKQKELDNTNKVLDSTKLELHSTNEALAIINKLVDITNKAFDIIKKELDSVNKKLDDLTAKQEEAYGNKHAFPPTP